MTAITVIVELRPSTELLLAIDGLAQAFNRFADRGQPTPKAPPPAKVGAAVDAGSPAAAGIEPEAPRPAAAVAKAASAAGDISAWVMTPERAALLRREWLIGVDVHGVLRRFNELPGKRLDAGRLGIAAVGIGLTRPKGFDHRTAPQTYDEALARQRPAAPPIPVAERIALHDDVGPVEAGFEQIAQWAQARGISFAQWDDLPRVNAKCEQLGLPTFKRKLLGRSVHRPAA